MTETTTDRDRWIAADMIDALHNAPTGYYDGMADPLYALESAGAVVVYWAGPTTRRQAERAIAVAGDEDPPDARAWATIADDPGLADLESWVADHDTPGHLDRDEYDAAARACADWLRDRGLPEVAATVTVERGVWSKGPRVTFRALGW